MVQVLIISQVEMDEEELLAVLADKLPDLSEEEFLAECEKFSKGKRVYLTKNERGITTIELVTDLQ